MFGGGERASGRGIVCNLVASDGGSGRIKPPVTGDPRPCSLWQLGPEKSHLLRHCNVQDMQCLRAMLLRHVFQGVTVSPLKAPHIFRSVISGTWYADDLHGARISGKQYRLTPAVQRARGPMHSILTRPSQEDPCAAPGQSLSRAEPGTAALISIHPRTPASHQPRSWSLFRPETLLPEILVHSALKWAYFDRPAYLLDHHSLHPHHVSYRLVLKLPRSTNPLAIVPRQMCLGVALVSP